MNWEIASWLLVCMSLIGNVFVIKKNVTGQWMWAFANLGWISYNLYLQAYAQAFLFGVYTCLCIWGIISWSKDAKQARAAA